MKLSKTIPIEVKSPNVQEHWSKKHKRNKIHAALIKYYMPELLEISPPCKISFIRIGTRMLDDDNLIFSFKGVRDSCVSLITGKKRGIGDEDPKFTFDYSQEKGEPSVKIEVEYDQS